MRAYPACVLNPRTRRTYPDRPRSRARAVYPGPRRPLSKISSKFTWVQVLTDQANARYRPDPVHSRGLHHHLPTTDRPARSCR
jgi:hypothetical protein